MLLSDSDIRKFVSDHTIGYEPYNERYLQPSSIDMTLDSMIRVPKRGLRAIDLKHVPAGHTSEDLIPEEGYVLQPGTFLLASTREVLSLPSFIAARVEGKSSLGRLGMAIHITAGYIDPGFVGNVTLEIRNFAPWSLRIYEGMPIAQVAFMMMNGPVEHDYGATGHYQGQRGPTESRFRIEA